MDYTLIDILRNISSYDRETVLGYQWMISQLDLVSYYGGGFGSEGLKILFPELEVSSQNTIAIATGERLMERSALIHQFEDGYFFRIADSHSGQDVLRINPAVYDIEMPGDLKFDLKISCVECSAYEVETEDTAILDCLQYHFAVTEIVDRSA